MAAAEATAHLDRTLDAVREILRDVSTQHSEQRLAPVFEVRPSLGSQNQVVLVVEVKLALAEDFDSREWPADEVAALKLDVRESLRGSVADDYDWFLLVQSQSDEAA